MAKNKSIIEKQQHELTPRCPVCGRIAHEAPAFSEFEISIQDLSPRPGDLTECDHCGALLECWDGPTSLIFKRARKERIESFNRLTNPGATLSELMEYVKKY